MAKKQINKNVVVLLSLFGFTGVILVSALMLRQLQQRDPQHFVTLAERYRQSSDFEQAALFYLKAFERSEDPTYLVAYGQMKLEGGDLRFAHEAWQRALIRQPDFIEAHQKLLNLLLELATMESRVSAWRQVEDAAQKMMNLETENKSPADQAFALHALGMAWTRLGSVEEGLAGRGVEQLREAVKLAPESAEYAIDLAVYLGETGKAEECNELYRGLLARFEGDSVDAAKVSLAHARHQSTGGRQATSKPDELFQQTLIKAAKYPDVLQEAQLAYASFLTQSWARAKTSSEPASTAQPLFDHAERILNEAIAGDPNGFDAYIQLALLNKLAGRFADTVATCERRIAGEFSRRGLSGIKNKLKLFSLFILASESCVAQAVSVGVGEAAAPDDQWLVRADQYVQRAAGEFSNNPRAMSQSGRIKLARGQDRSALEDLRAADQAYRGSSYVDWQNKMLLARVHIKLGEPGAAKAVLDEAYEFALRQRSTDPAFWTLYGQVLLMTNDLDGALTFAEQVLRFDPGYVDARQLKAAVYERRGKLSVAGDLHEQATGSPTVRTLLRVREFVQEGHFEEAVRELKAALEKEPAEPRLVLAAVTQLRELNRLEEAAQIVAKAQSVRPDDSIFKKLAVWSRPDLSADQRDEALLEIMVSEQDAYLRAMQIADLQFRRGKLSEALSAINESEQHLLKKDSPLARSATSSDHRYLLSQKLRIAAQLSDASAMDAARDSAAQHDVDGAKGKSILGLYHALRQETDLAIAAYQQAVDAQPTDSLSLMYAGHCLQIAGRVDDAQVFYERSIRANPDAALAHRGLAAIAQSRGDKETYEKSLAVCERLIPQDPWVKAELVARKEQSDPVGAISRREAELATQPKDAVNLHRLARLCEEVKDFSKADQYYARLLEVQPDDQLAVMSAAKYFRRTDRPDRALSALETFARSRQTSEQRANAMVLVAAHHLNQGRLPLVETTLREAADTALTLDVAQALAEYYVRTVNQPEKALPWYDKGVDIAVASKSPQLALVQVGRIACVMHRAINDVDKGQGLVTEFRRSYPDDARGVYWESEVHARKGLIERGVAVLSEYLHRVPDDANMLYHRARQYLSLGRNAQALEDLERIKRISPLALNLDPRVAIAQIHVRAGKGDLAIRELESLVVDAPDSPRAGEELAMAYLRAKRLPDAERVVTTWINRSAEEVDPRWLFLRAVIHIDNGQAERAIGDAQQAVQTSGYSPEGVSKILDIYQRLGRFAEGARYYERHANNFKTNARLVSRYA
ncbi:MAG: tetratricopeptide repeat protein, partial [Planctomycetota bacterium]